MLLIMASTIPHGYGRIHCRDDVPGMCILICIGRLWRMQCIRSSFHAVRCGDAKESQPGMHRSGCISTSEYIPPGRSIPRLSVLGNSVPRRLVTICTAFFFELESIPRNP